MDIETMDLVVRSAGFSSLLLIIGIIFLYKWAKKAWETVAKIVDRYNDTLLKVTVVMEKVLSHVEKD